MCYKLVSVFFVFTLGFSRLVCGVVSDTRYNFFFFDTKGSPDFIEINQQDTELKAPRLF